MKKKLLLSLPYSMSARNFLRNDSLVRLNDTFDVVIVTHLTDDPGFVAEFAAKYQIIRYPKISIFAKIILRILVNIETSIWLDRVYISSFEIIRKSIKLGYADDLLKANSGIFSFWTLFLKKLPFFRILVNRLFYLVSKLTYSKFGISEYDIVINTHPYTYEERLMASSLSPSTVSIASIHSWDNVTTKPTLIHVYHRMIVWNNIIKNQIIRLYNYQPRNIIVTGMPQSDFYYNLDPNNIKYFVYKYLNLEANKKIITYACACPEFVPSQEYVVRDIINSMKKLGLFTDDYILVIREHPGRILPKVLELVDGISVFLDRPSIAFDPNVNPDGWDSTQQDQLGFYSLMQTSSVLINCFSTTTIDAAIVNTPIINVAYDATPGVNYYASLKKHYDWEHYVDIVKSNGAYIANDSTELCKFIYESINMPELFKAERARIVKEQITFVDGKSINRMIDVIKEFQ